MRKKKSPSLPEEIQVNMQVTMPRVLVDSQNQESVSRAEKVMEMLSHACLAIISANKDVQLCMNMLSFVSENDKTLHIALNQDKPFDIDHFRIMVIALTTSYEEIMGGFQVKIIQPIDFQQIEQANGIPNRFP